MLSQWEFFAYITADDATLKNMSKLLTWTHSDCLYSLIFMSQLVLHFCQVPHNCNFSFHRRSLNFRYLNKTTYDKATCMFHWYLTVTQCVVPKQSITTFCNILSPATSWCISLACVWIISGSLFSNSFNNISVSLAFVPNTNPKEDVKCWYNIQWKVWEVKKMMIYRGTRATTN